MVGLLVGKLTAALTDGSSVNGWKGTTITGY